MRRLGLSAAAALVLVTGAITLSRGETEAPAGPAPAATALTGIAQDGIALGDPAAPATLVEFADLQCPFCGVYGRDVLPAVVDRYVRTGKLRLELHVLAFLGEDSVRAGQVAAGAASQDRLWAFAEAFYADQGEENSGYVTDEFLRSTTANAGVDLAARAQDDTDAAGVLERAQAEAERLGVQGTPSFFLRRNRRRARPGRVRRFHPGRVRRRARRRARRDDARLRVVTAALALAGVAVAAYLTWVHYAGLQPICVGGSGACERVQNSDYALLFGVPVAAARAGGRTSPLLGSLAAPG